MLKNNFTASGEAHGQQSFYFEHLRPLNNEKGSLHTIANERFHKIFFLREAGGIHQIGGNYYTISPHSVHIVLKDQYHSFDKAVLVSGYGFFVSDKTFFSFLPESFAKSLHFGGNLFVNPIISLNKNEFDTVDSLIGSINECFTTFLNGTTELAESYLSLLFNYTYLRYVRRAETGISFCNSVKNRIVKEYIGLVEIHFKKHYTVKYYANELCVTPNYLNELCKKETGKTAHEVIKDKLIIEAKQILLHTNKAVKEVSYELGFCSPSHFTYFFKQHTGITPEGYKRER